ncbi:MAG: VanZ family protein [Gammaproteobacteria bacterium]|nr:VanZ family protein [Gammaproteobacteria bacterium]
MLPLRHAHVWRIADVVLLVSVLVFALTPATWFLDDAARTGSWMRNVDKWLHGTTFLVLTLWYAGQYRRRSYWRIAVGLLGFGMFIELCQRMLSYRSADWLDMGANTAGIVLGLIIAIAGVGGWCQRVEAWHAARQTGSKIG